MAIYKVIKNYSTSFDNPITLSRHEYVKCLKESDPLGDWPDWVLCKTDNNEGWVPSQIINLEGDIGKITEDYSALEFNLTLGEYIISNRELNGWVWGYKESNPKCYAWAPLNHLESVKQF